MDTKSQILKKARKLFAKHGFDGVSIRSICQKVSCNVSAISYHFGSKEELYRACLEDDSQSIVHMMDSILTPVENAADFKAKLKLAMLQFFDYSVENRELILIITKDVNSKMAIETIHKIFQRVPLIFTEFFRSAQQQGIIRQNMDPAFLADHIVQPYFFATLFSESSRVLKQKNLSDANIRMQLVDQHLELFFQGIIEP